MRIFDSGGTRDSDEDKLDHEGFSHPLVEQAYAQYMHKHRKQADGKLRDSDNWQKLFGEDHLQVCMKSGYRHFFDWWSGHRGKDIDIVEALCALRFNVNAYLYKVLLDQADGRAHAHYTAEYAHQQPDTYAVITDTDGEPVKTITEIPELGKVEGVDNE